VINHPLGKLLSGIIGHMLFEQPSQETPASADREADGKGELVAEGAVVPGW
jgi:hypothetical protein